MPTYVYKFLDTGETLEIQQSFADDTLTEAVHPRTGETMAVKKVFQPVGVTFKGDGFYKTDSRSSSKTGTAIEERVLELGRQLRWHVDQDRHGRLRQRHQEERRHVDHAVHVELAIHVELRESKSTGGSSATTSGTTPSSG